MKTIHVNASKSYDILIERGILDRAGEEIKTVCGAGEALIVSDDTLSDTDRGGFGSTGRK